MHRVLTIRYCDIMRNLSLIDTRITYIIIKSTIIKKIHQGLQISVSTYTTSVERAFDTYILNKYPRTFIIIYLSFFLLKGKN